MCISWKLKCWMCVGLHVEHALFLSGFNENWIFPTDFRKIPNLIISSGSRVAFCGHTDRHDETNSRFSQFCEKQLTKTEEITQLTIVINKRTLRLLRVHEYIPAPQTVVRMLCLSGQRSKSLAKQQTSPTHYLPEKLSRQPVQQSVWCFSIMVHLFLHNTLEKLSFFEHRKS